ncbi:MAG: hypothetical protein H6Q73_4204 [Firmicutes bacterium]|nr:hypothetical protein [Bacillota bacterium]
MTGKIVCSFRSYWGKVSSGRCCDIKAAAMFDCIWAALGAIIGIGIITYLTFLQGIPVLVASLGASACLIYGVPEAPFSQPRNVLFGHLISAVIGVALYQMFGNNWLTAAVSVGVAIGVMLRTGTVHPPAGATALIAVITQQGWLFPILPVGVGVCILILVGILVNNLAVNRQYPRYWF